LEYWKIKPPLITNDNDLEKKDIYKQNFINLDNLVHLENIGFIHFNQTRNEGYKLTGYKQDMIISYFERKVKVKFNNNNTLLVGKIMFSKIGKELFNVVNAVSIPNFFEFSIKYWENSGVELEEIVQNDK